MRDVIFVTTGQHASKLNHKGTDKRICTENKSLAENGVFGVLGNF